MDSLATSGMKYLQGVIMLCQAKHGLRTYEFVAYSMMRAMLLPWLIFALGIGVTAILVKVQQSRFMIDEPFSEWTLSNWGALLGFINQIVTMTKESPGVEACLPPSSRTDKESHETNMAFEYLACVEATNEHGLSGFLWFLSMSDSDWEGLVVSKTYETQRQKQEEELAKQEEEKCGMVSQGILLVLMLLLGTAWMFSIAAFLINTVIVTDQKATEFGGWCGIQEEVLWPKLRDAVQNLVGLCAYNTTDAGNSTRR